MGFRAERIEGLGVFGFAGWSFDFSLFGGSGLKDVVLGSAWQTLFSWIVCDTCCLLSSALFVGGLLTLNPKPLSYPGMTLGGGSEVQADRRHPVGSKMKA